MLDEGLKKGLVAGILAALIVTYLLTPLLSWVGSQSVKIISLFSSRFVDYIYWRAAVPIPSSIETLLITSVVIMTLPIMFTLLLMPTGAEVYGNFFRVPFILFIIFLVVSASLLTFTGGLSARFEGRIIIIAPHISEQEEELIRSKWLRIQGKEDFDVIKQKLDKIAEQNNIKFPGS